MARPPKKAPTYELYFFGVDHLVILEFFDDTKPLVKNFAIVNSALLEGMRAIEDCEVAVSRARALLRLVDMTADNLIRMIQQSALKADGGAPGNVTAAVFPDGISGIVNLVGQSQVKAMGELIDCIEKNPKAAPLRDEWLAKLKESTQKYADTVAARDASIEAASKARASLRIQRETWFDTIVKHQGFVTMTYPRNKRMQDVFFAPRRTRTAPDAVEEPEDGAAESDAGEGDTSASH